MGLPAWGRPRRVGRAVGGRRAPHPPARAGCWCPPGPQRHLGDAARSRERGSTRCTHHGASTAVGCGACSGTAPRAGGRRPPAAATPALPQGAPSTGGAGGRPAPGAAPAARGAAGRPPATVPPAGVAAQLLLWAATQLPAARPQGLPKMAGARSGVRPQNRLQAGQGGGVEGRAGDGRASGFSGAPRSQLSGRCRRGRRVRLAPALPPCPPARRPRRAGHWRDRSSNGGTAAGTRGALRLMGPPAALAAAQRRQPHTPTQPTSLITERCSARPLRVHAVHSAHVRAIPRAAHAPAWAGAAGP